MSSSYSRPSLQITGPTPEYAPNGRPLSPPPKSPRSPTQRFPSPTNTPSKGASWLFNTLSARPKISNGIEHQAQLSGLKPPVIDEDERETKINPSNTSVLSFNSSVEVASDGGHRRGAPARSLDAVHSRQSDDGYVRVHKPSTASVNGMRKSDTLPRPRTSETIDRVKDSSSSSNTPLTSLYLVSGQYALFQKSDLFHMAH